MAISFPSLATAKATIAGYWQTLLGGWDLSSKGVFGKVKAAHTLTVYSFLSTARQIDRDAVPTSSTSVEGIAEWAENGVGIPNGAGGYGPLVSVTASGGVVTLTGTAGTVYVINSTLTASDGVTKFVLTAAATVGGGGTISGNVNATTKGTAGNLQIGAVLSVDSVPVGGNVNATLTTALAGGLDAEDKSATLSRIQFRLRNPPKGGVATDYRYWCENATTPAGAAISNIRAWVYPLRKGTGTVYVVVTNSAADVGTARPSGDAANIKTYLETVRPVTVNGDDVVAAYQPSGAATTIVMRPVPSTTANAFQFDSTAGGPYTVAAYSAGTPSVTLNNNCADLNTQVNTNTRQVLIQVVARGTELPQESTVVAYNSVSKIATLSKAFDVAPTVGDPIYASSPMVLPIAKAVRSMVNALGPSRASGHADARDPWADTLYIDQLIRVAMDAVDENGGAVALSLLASPTIDGATVDKQATDDGTNAPQLLYIKTAVAGGITVKP